MDKTAKEQKSINSATEEIRIRVDSQTALAFNSVSEEEKRKLEIIINLQLQEAMSVSDSLTNIMDKISREAEIKGLNPPILQSLLENE